MREGAEVFFSSSSSIPSPPLAELAAHLFIFRSVFVAFRRRVDLFCRLQSREEFLAQKPEYNEF